MDKSSTDSADAMALTFGEPRTTRSSSQRRRSHKAAIPARSRSTIRRFVNGFVQTRPEAGKPTGKKVALNGDDPARIAGRLTREACAKWARESNFNPPLTYRPLGVA